MAVFKCKMCGGALDVGGNDTVCRCTYCGTEQTLPRLDNETRNRLYDRANYYRRSNEFDRAEAVYENILSEAPDEAEAHWGICLCRYGIEYVRDPHSGKMIPTCHRTQFRSILEDSSYLMAVKYSDGAASSVYKSEADAIDKVQKRILAISGRESPFDIFICYKEKDDSGERTPASVEAQEIYDELTEKGYKVFFSRITLEDKLGQEYEPYIFAALQSAKVMLVVGTKPEHFSSVWVKNEWSRFLSFISQGQKKHLIPCYKDMNPYDLPEELVSLQAQDLSKLGAVQDISHAVDKLLAGSPAAATGANADSLTERAFLFLEDKNWKNADIYCEKALDVNPRCSRAYLGKLLAELKLSSENELLNLNVPISKNDSFEKAMRFADDEYRASLECYDKQIRLNSAAMKLNRSHYPSEISDIITELRTLGGYGDSLRLIGEAERRLNELKSKVLSDAESLVNSPKSGADLMNALRLLKETDDSYNAEALTQKAEKQLSDTYRTAKAEMDSGDYKAAEKNFRWLCDYEDSVAQCYKCARIIQQAEINMRNDRVIAERANDEIEAIRRNRIRNEKMKERTSTYSIFTMVIVVALLIIAVILFKCYTTAYKHEHIMAQNYRMLTYFLSPLAVLLLTHAEVRAKGEMPVAKGYSFKSVSFFITFLNIISLRASGASMPMLAAITCIHIAAFAFGIWLGKKVYSYYFKIEED